MRDQTRALVLALAAALAGGAATQVEAQTSEAAATAPAETQYKLVQVSGKPLPALVEKEWRCQEDVLSGTLTLRDDGRWLLETVIRETCGDRTEEDRDSDDGRYRAEGNTIRFFDDDGEENTDRDDDDIDLDEFKTGIRADDGSLTVQLADGRTTLLFRR